MPRSNRPRRGGRRPAASPAAPLDLERALSGTARRERHRDGEWFVRPVVGAEGRRYRCPGCDHEIAAGVAHVVVWAADDLLGDESAVRDRRHWHRPCWAARTRRARG